MPLSRAPAWAAGCATVVLVLTALIALGWSPLLRFDDHVITSAVGWTTAHSALIDPLSTLGVLSGKRVMWPLAAVLAGVLWLTGRRYPAVMIAVSVGSTTFVTGVIKRLLDRDRPEGYVPEDPLPTSSFPSGHVALWVALVGVLLVLLLGQRRTVRPAVARVVSVGLVLLTTVICLQRVLLGRHYPSDVLAGILVGTACVLVTWVIVDHLWQQFQAPRHSSESPASSAMRVTPRSP